jgi:hypothetical protein
LKGVFEDLIGEERRDSRYRIIGLHLGDLARCVQSMYINAIVNGERGDVNYKARDINKYYRDPAERREPDSRLPGGSNILNRGSNVSLGRSRIPEGEKIINVPGGMSIKEIAGRFLGSPARWKEIVLLNGLRAPYISKNGDGVNVVRPGDSIKVPASPSSDDKSQVFAITNDDMRNDYARRYGRDLLMDSDTLDLVVNDQGDLATVEGLDNLRQAIDIKIKTSPGDLKVHPWFGFSGKVGVGLEIDQLAKYQMQVRNTILSDTRVDRIESLNVSIANGDTVIINAKVIPKDNDGSVSLDTLSRLSS